MEDDDVVVLIERDRCCAAVLSGRSVGRLSEWKNS